MLETHRRLYNDALAYRIMMWKGYHRSESAISIQYSLKDLRIEDPYLAECNFNALGRTLRRLDRAYDAFFRRVKTGKESPGFPKFKSRKHFNSMGYTYNNGIRLKHGRLYIQKVGLIRIFLDRPLPENATPKAAVVKLEGQHRWHVIIQCELRDSQVEQVLDSSIGIDMGLEWFCALSTGELIENPRWRRKSESKLATLQKRQARCRSGSKQYRQLARQINTLYRRTASRRHDFHHKLSTRLAKEFGIIGAEDLNIKGLAKSHVRKSIGDAGWGAFLHMLEYKTQGHGSQLVRVDARGTSQICSECGCVVKKSLSERVHSCPECGYTAHRDVNAARVIKHRALNILLDRQAA